MKIILGSQSQGRQQVLQEAGYKFETMVADVDEKAIRDKNPKKLVLKLANAKADALVKKIKELAILITADQVVTYRGQIREKPKSYDQSYEWLQSYAKSPAWCVNGIVVTNTKTGKRAEAVEISKVYFQPIPEKVIEDFIATGVPFECAGGFRTRHLLISPYVKKIEGTMDSLMGLPLKFVEQLIEKVK